MPAPMKLDPRIEPLFRSRAPHERFLAIGLCALLAQASLLDGVISEFQGKDVDWSESIGGNPLFAYNGKNKAQLRREGVSPVIIEQVAQAFTRRDMVFPEGEAAKASSAITEAPKRVKAVVTVAPTEPVETAPPVEPQGETAPPDEPTFGAAKLPLSHFTGMSRKQILAVEGISPKVADQIQHALA